MTIVYMGDWNNRNACFDKTFPFNIGDDVYVMDIEYSPRRDTVR